MVTSPRSAFRPRTLPARKPMARARRVSLFRREVRLWLSSAASEILFDYAQILSEGELDGARYAGSTMLTFDLAHTESRVSDACDHVTTAALVQLVSRDTDMVARVERLALAEAETIAGHRLVAAQIDLRARRVGHQLFIDVDIEATPEDVL